MARPPKPPGGGEPSEATAADRETTAEGARSGPRWLTAEELAAWAGLQRMQARLTGTLGRDLAEHSDLSLPDYAVLVELTERSDGRMRPFELGRVLGWEKSRLSHHLARMVARGLVTRQRCPSDQRGWVVVVSPLGRQTMEGAAPSHVAAVRRAFVDRLTPAQLDTVAEVARIVLADLADGAGAAGDGQGDGSCGADRPDDDAGVDGGPRC